MERNSSVGSASPTFTVVDEAPLDDLPLEPVVKKILCARVYEVCKETPISPAPQLSKKINNTVVIKREDLHSVFSFKIRGAYNKIAGLSDEDRAKGIITASAGNHAQGVAMSAQKLGIKATIVMPIVTPLIKVDAVRSRGENVNVVLKGDNFNEASDHCQQLLREHGYVDIFVFIYVVFPIYE